MSYNANQHKYLTWDKNAKTNYQYRLSLLLLFYFTDNSGNFVQTELK